MKEPFSNSELMKGICPDCRHYAECESLCRPAQIYLSKRKLMDSSWQIDILAIEIYRDGTFDIRHLENAVEDFW